MQILPATHTDVLKNIHKSCSPEYKCYTFDFRYDYISWQIKTEPEQMRQLGIFQKKNDHQQ